MTALPDCFAHDRGWLDREPGDPGAIMHRRTFCDLVNYPGWRQERIRAYGAEHAVPRMTAWFGDAPYAYSGIVHHPSVMPASVALIRARLERECGVWFNSCLANLYRHGADSVAWHADDEPELGTDPVIASVSLGAARRFKIRANARDILGTRPTWDLELGHGDLLVMRGRSQADYQHCVPRTSLDVGPRINLTFRRVG